MLICDLLLGIKFSKERKMKKTKLLKSTAGMLAAVSMMLTNVSGVMACPIIWDWGCGSSVSSEEVVVDDSNSSAEVISGETETLEDETSNEQTVEDANGQETLITDENDGEEVLTDDQNEVNDDEIIEENNDTESEDILVTDEETETDEENTEDAEEHDDVEASTFLEDGGSYSVGFILNNYNLFIKNSIVDTNHTMGPIAAGGDAEITYWGMRGVIFDANSFIRGELKQNEWYASVGGGVLYLGSVNDGKYEWRVSRDPDDDDFGGCYVNVETGKGIHNTRQIIISDDYIDFDAAFDSIKSDIAGLDVDYVIDVNAESDAYSFSTEKTATTLNIRAGSTYSIDSLAGISKINIYGADIQSAIDTILIVTGSEDVEMFPDVKVNGTLEDSAEYGKNSSIVFVLPNTSNITMRSSHAHFGHIIAPEAFVRFPGGGDYNGCVISKDFTSERHEGHMWPYNGKKFEGAATGFKVLKTVDGEIPSADEVFDFTLSEAKDGQWNEIQTVSNNGAQAAFDTIAYTLNDEGTHYYKVVETGDKEGYIKDSSVYIVEVSIENVQSGRVINQNKTERYFKFDADVAATDVEMAINDANRADTISFDNKKEEEPEIPEEPTPEIKVTKVYVDKCGKPVNDGTQFYVVLSATTGYCWWTKTVYYDLEGKEYSCKKVVPIKAGETITFKNLAYGVKYTVTETDKCGNTISCGNGFDVVKGSETVCLSDKCSSKTVEIKNVKKCTIPVCNTIKTGCTTTWYCKTTTSCTSAKTTSCNWFDLCNYGKLCCWF